MALLRNGAEGGTNGTTITTANTGGASGDALSDISLGSGGLVFSNASSAHGSLSYMLTGASGSATYLGWNGYNDTSMATRFYYNVGSAEPGVQLTLLSVRSASAKVALVVIGATGKLSVQDSTGTNIHNFSNPLSTNTYYRIELTTTVSASAASVACSYYAGDSTTASESFTTTTANTGSANITEVRIGSGASTTWTGSSYLDDLAANNGSTTFIGPYTAPGVPSAPTGVSATAGNALATVTFTTPTNNGGASITGYTATATPGGATGSISGASAAPITVSGLNNGTSYTFTVHATNANGNSSESSSSGSVTPAAPGGTLVNNSAEGGTNGTTISTANTGGASGNALTNISIGSGAGLIFSTASSAHGSRSYALTGASGSASYLGWNGYSDTSMASRFYYNMGSALPGVQVTLLAIRSASAKVALVVIGANGKLSVQDSTGSNVYNFLNPLSTNTYYRIELAVTISATAAKIQCDYYAGDGTSPVETGYYTTSGNTASANITEVRFGSAASVTWTGTSYFDELAVVNGSSTYIGPSSAPSAPTAVTAANGPGGVNVSFTPGSTGGSAISSYVATSTPGSLTAHATSSPIVFTTLTSETSYTFTVHATNSIGTSSESSSSNSVMASTAAPTANAGSAQTVNARSTVTLSGSYTTASSHTATLLWTAGSGAPAITSGATSTTATIADIGGGVVASGGDAADITYSYTLTVTQDDSQTANASVTITVSYANRFLAHAGSWQPAQTTKHAVSSSWT